MDGAEPLGLPDHNDTATKPLPGTMTGDNNNYTVIIITMIRRGGNNNTVPRATRWLDDSKDAVPRSPHDDRNYINNMNQNQANGPVISITHYTTILK